MSSTEYFQAVGYMREVKLQPKQSEKEKLNEALKHGRVLKLSHLAKEFSMPVSTLDSRIKRAGIKCVALFKGGKYYALKDVEGLIK